MMRSLWTAASGMKGQQTNVDTIANNLANALLNNETFETELYFGEYIIQEVKVEKGNIVKYWTKESQKCPN